MVKFTNKNFLVRSGFEPLPFSVTRALRRRSHLTDSAMNSLNDMRDRDMLLQYLDAESWRFTIRVRLMCYVSCFLPNVVPLSSSPPPPTVTLTTQNFRQILDEEKLRSLGLVITITRYLQLYKIYG